MNTSQVVAGRPAHILIVDDEPRNRKLLEVMLAPEGFSLLSAASGEEALAMVAQHRLDLILLDVMMPGLGGYEVATQLKSNLATKHIPIIMVTALDDRDARMFGLTAGAEDFLTKPVDRAELSVRVRNLLRLKAGADEALRHRDDSMGMVSHDLRNLLTGITLNAESLADAASDSDDGKRLADGMERICKYAARMDRLIGDLVDVVSIDAGKLALRPQQCDAAVLLAESVEASALAAAQVGVALESKTFDLQLTASLDRGRILQVLANLVANALKFTPRGGAIAIRGERIADELRVSITDTGIGMPSELLETIFQRFIQVGKSDGRGLGLGLYISRCIVESHGGRIWAESTLGAGSTFHFSIPDSISPAAEAAC